MENIQASPLQHLSRPFRGVRFVLFGFDHNNRFQILSKLVEGGGVDVGVYGPNCTHVIVDKLVYDDPVCVAARSDGNILLTSLWVEHSFDLGMPADKDNVMYWPLHDLMGIPGAKSLVVGLTGYQRQDREDIMTMVGLMGANFSKPLIAHKVTHLVCYKFEGEKYELAKRKKIKLVNHRWLEDSLKAWEILPEANYDKSTYELDMMEAEAKDSEEETEDIATKKCADEATSAQQNQNAKVEVSRNLLDSSAHANVDTLVHIGKETTSGKATDLDKVDNLHHEVLGSLKFGALKDVKLGEQSNQYDGIKTPSIIGNGLVSTSTGATNSPHSDAAKSGPISYLWKTPRTTSPILSGEMTSNLHSNLEENTAKCNMGERFNNSYFKSGQTIGGSNSELLLAKMDSGTFGCTSGGSKVRQPAMCPEDDQVLCEAYCYHSGKSVTGTNQSGSALWEKITAKYNMDRAAGHPERSLSSLSSRFHMISAAVKLFSAKLTHAKNHLSSGRNEMDAYNEALEMYRMEKGKLFTFGHCVSILMNNAKFNPQTTQYNTQQRRGSISSNSVGSPNLGSSDESTEYGVPTSQETVYSRPIGRDTPKKLAKKQSSKDKGIAAMSEQLKCQREVTADIIETLNTMKSNSIGMKTHMAMMLEIRQKEYKLKEQEALRLEKEGLRLEESSLLAINRNNLTEEQLAYVNLRWEDLIARREKILAKEADLTD